MTAVKPVLTKEQILSAKDYDLEEVDVPEWGGVVFLRSMSGKARQQFEEFLYKHASGEGIVEGRPLLLSLCLCDSEGTLLFSSAELEDLLKKNADTLTRLSDVAMKLNGLLTKKQVEIEVKN